SGGTVTTVTAYSSAYQILLRRLTTKTQTVNIDDEEVEEALDKLTRGWQEVVRDLGLCLKIQPSESGDTVQLPAKGTAGYLYRAAAGGITTANTVSGVTAVTPWTGVLPGLTTNANRLSAKADLNLNHVIDVRDYGATGDGTTDDAPAIQAAYAAAIAAQVSDASDSAVLTTYGRPTLYFPKGVYNISESISQGVANGFLRIEGSDAIIHIADGQYAFDVGPYTYISGLQFQDGAYALKVSSGAAESRVSIVECRFTGQTTAAILEDNTCGNGTVLVVDRCRLISPSTGTSQILHADSGDMTIFRDCWIYGASGNNSVFDATCTLYLENCLLNPYHDLEAWVDQRANLHITHCRFGGENDVNNLVRCYTAAAAFPAGPETELKITNSSVYTPGDPNVVSFYGIPNHVQITDNAGFTTATRLWFDSSIDMDDVNNVGSYDGHWDVARNTWPIAGQINTGPASAQKGIIFAQDDHRRHTLAELNAADYLVNASGWDAGYGRSSATNCGTTSVPADDEDGTLGNGLYTATADGQYFALGYTTMLNGLSAQILTAAVTATVLSDYTVELQLTAHHAVMIRTVGPGRHTLCLPFYYDANGPDTVQLAAYNMKTGASVQVERFQILAGEHEVIGKRANLVGTAAPVASAWHKGDTLRVLAPAAGGAREYVCTAGGTPGTWEPAGAIGGVIEDVNNITADITNFYTHGLHIISSNAAEITGALADGTVVGQRVKFVCKVAGNNIDISVSHHVTSDPEVIRLDAAKEAVELVWDGTDWVETDVVGAVSYP
ncbi:MAG: hypothetical protein EHM35_01830, partial [Planctomycetaceae bacterium]